ncbi:toll-like receptor 3 [Haliotis rubra]|uniref:toll-like receptor 3 n=1 Tax=Haliotis rubra TaxID=36100 RepID=UPI001EE5BA9A|nr:toll-like receptor 3 [Haliotis rubra]
MKITCGLILVLTVATSCQQSCQIWPAPQLGGVRADCQNLNLTSVPDNLPPNTVSLDLSRNNITVLIDNAFVRLPRLLSLTIAYSQVSRLETNAFKGLTRLLSLHLDHNNLQLDNDTYPEHVFSPLQSLTELNIGYNDCRISGSAPDWVFKWLMNLETLTIDTFQYDVFGSGFGYLQKLVTLNIATGVDDNCIYCAITVIQNHTFSVFENTSVQVLDVHDCKLMTVDVEAYLPFKHISKIVLENVMTLPTGLAVRAFFGLNGKNVSQVLLKKSNKYVSLNRNLQNQLLNKETLTHLSDICIEHLDLRYNHILYIDRSLLPVMSRCIKYIDLSKKQHSGGRIRSFPNLTHLALNNMCLDDDTLIEGGPVLEGLKTMPALRYLEIAGNDLRYTDLGSLRTLRSLNVSRNNLVSVPFQDNDLPDLLILDMSVNSITFFDDDTIEMLENLGKKNKLVLKLTGNPFSCSCKSLAFVQWIFSSSVTFDSNGNYSCVTEFGVLTTTNTMYKEFNYHWTSCQGRFWLPVAISLICVTTLLIVCALLVSRNWTRIAHHILVFMGRGIQRVNRQDFNKDAYIAHSDQELQFVMQDLRIGLEEILGLKLILPERDFLPGPFVADHVVESINRSWKTVLVVSDDFLDDPWSYFIIKSTTYYISNLNPNRVILLLVGDVNHGRLPELLLNVTDEEDIIQLDDFPDPHSDVWVRVRDRILTPAA